MLVNGNSNFSHELVDGEIDVIRSVLRLKGLIEVDLERI